MKNTANLAFTIILLACSQFSFAQGQLLIEPKMEIVDLSGMEARNLREGLQMRTAGLSSIRVGQLTIAEGTSTPSHNHAFEQMVIVLEGSIKAFSGEKEYILGPGQMFMAPAYVHHYYTALEDSLTLEVFSAGVTTPAP